LAEVLSLDPSGEDAHRVELRQRIAQFSREHRDLNEMIERMSRRSDFDALEITRLKRRKLLLKDQIAWLERQLDPDARACAPLSVHAPVLIVEPDNVVLAEIVAALDLDHYQRHGCGIAEPVLGFHGNERRFVCAHRVRFLAARHIGNAAHDHPVLAPPVVQLKR